jgi:hypothetical protein
MTDVVPVAIAADGKTVIFTYTRALSELYVANGLR